MGGKNSPLKIAFVGTSCTGKTTLIEYYKNLSIPNLTIVPEAARQYFTKKPQIENRFSALVQSEVQDWAIRNEKKAHNSHASKILCDRSVLDAVAYVYSQKDYKGSRLLLDKVRDWIPTYHEILLLDPKDIAYKTDSVRKEDNNTRQKFHEAFVKLFEKEKIPYKLSRTFEVLK